LVKEFEMRFEGRLLNVISISIGISFFPENGLSKSQILNTADMALFRAKNEGRGRVIISDQFI
jgi:diguanylate cyclase (GGDEF)-like protein